MFSLLAPIVAFAFAALVLTAATKDALSFTIPNWISLTLLALFPAAAVVSGQPMAALAPHLAVGAGALVLGIVMFALGWIGGGDAKLAAAVGLWLGWPAVTTFLLVAALAGGFLALALITLRSAVLRHLVLMGPAWVGRLAEPGEGVPYGVAIAIGAFAAFPASPLAAGLGLPVLGV